MASGHPPFDLLKKNLDDLIHQVEDKLGARTPEDGSQEIKRCSSLLSKLEMEARGAPTPSLKQDLLDVVEALSFQLDTYHAQNERNLLLRYDAQNDRNPSPGPQPSGSSAPRKKQMNETLETAHRQNSRLTSALQSLQETEQIAAGISGELGAQRDTLNLAHGNTKDARSNLKRGNELVKIMQKRWFT